MAMLAELVDGAIGVDTLTAAAVSNLGGVLAQTTTSADAAGYQHLVGFACSTVPGRRVWAVEGAGSFVLAWPGSCSSAGHTSSRSAGPSGQHRAPAPRVTRWTPSGPPGKPSAKTTWPPRASVASGRLCGCCWPPDAAPRWLGWPPSASSKP